MFTSLIHPASSGYSALHSSDLQEIARMEMGSLIIRNAADFVVAIVDNSLRSTSSSTISLAQRDTFLIFITDVLSRAEAYVNTHTLLVALIYIGRAKHRMIFTCKEWALERVLLGSLIVAHKYLNDGPLRNSAWACIAGTFTTQGISRIEREFLHVVAFELSIQEEDLLSQYDLLASL